MSGYKRDIVMRLVPKNGGETVYWFEDQLTDAGGHTRCTVRYPETMTMREDINRNLRPVIFGVRPEVDIECQIATMADQAFLAGIEDALLRPREYQVFLSLDGGVVEREVVLASGSMPDPLRGKTYVGARFQLSLRCKSMIDRKPVMTTDPLTGAEFLADGSVEAWSGGAPVTWSGTSGVGTVAQETTIIASDGGLSSAKVTRSDSGTFFQFAPSGRALQNIREARWYRWRFSVRATAAMSNSLRLRITNSTKGLFVNSNGKTWDTSSHNFVFQDAPVGSFSQVDAYFRASSAFEPDDLLVPQLCGNWTASESLYYDAMSVYGPALRPGYSTW